MDNIKYIYIKRFTKEAKEFLDTANSTCSSLNECLNNIAALDFSLLSASKLELNIFFNSLWEVMSRPNGPHWSGVTVLITAAKDASTKYYLIHSYRFLPLLTEILLTKNLLFDNKLKLLKLMEELSYGIKITWQEPHLDKLIENICAWCIDFNKDANTKEISMLSLSILVNLCYGNLFVTSLVMKIVDTRYLVKQLVSRKDYDYGSVQVCRFLMALHSVQGTPSANDVHNYIGVSLRTFINAIRDMDSSALHYVDLLFNDLCCDPLTKTHMLSYDHFETMLHDALKLTPALIIGPNENSKECIRNVFNILTNLVKLELYSLRVSHKTIADLCVDASNIPDLLGPALSLLAAVILQYEEDGMLPDILMPTVSMAFQALLDPSCLDPKLAGLDWLRFISALCDCHATREAVFVNVDPEKFEELFKQNVQHQVSVSNNKNRCDQEIVLIACQICLSLVQRSDSWMACLHNILSFRSVANILNNCINHIQNSNRKQILRIIRNADFPIDRLNGLSSMPDTSDDCNLTQESLNNSNSQMISYGLPSNQPFLSPQLSSSQESSLNELITKMNETLENNEISNIPASNIMELYGYKINSLEGRLNNCMSSLQSANLSVIKLNQSISVHHAINKRQEELLIRTQIRNEKLEENLARLSEQMNDAEKTVKKFQGKLTAERLDKEQQLNNAHHEFTQNIKNLETQIEKGNMKMEELNMQIKNLETVNNNVTEKLNDQTKKNSELAGVLVKFEDRVKQRDRKLEEVNHNYNGLKSEHDQAQQTVKNLEKTLLERDKRLHQVTTQLEEMQRIQDMIANLMGNKTGSNVSSNSLS